MSGITSYLSVDIEIEGEIYCTNPVRIDGFCQGIIEGEKEIMIGTKGKIEGKIQGKNVVVSGKVKGRIFSDQVKLLKHGHVEGEIKVASGGVWIEKGGMLDGKLKIEPKSKLILKPIATK